MWLLGWGWAWAAEPCPSATEPTAAWITQPTSGIPQGQAWAALADAWLAELACRPRPVEPREAATLHLVLANRAASERPSEVPLALLAATSVPDGAPDPWVPVPGGVEVARASPWVAVAVPEGVALFVDGHPAVSRPIDRPAVYQIVGAGGRVIWAGYLRGDQDVPGINLRSPPTPEERQAARAVLDQVTALLAEGQFDEVVRQALPAAARYPDLAPAFQAAAALAVDQKQREAEGSWANLAGPIVVAARPEPRERWGVTHRGDPRSGLLLGFDVGVPIGFRGEWKIGGRAVDGMGIRVGGGLLLGDVYGYTGSDSSTYLDWNLTRRWQLETLVGVFVTAEEEVFGTVGVALQYDPASPVQINLGARVGGSYIAPDISLGFLW